MEGNGGSCLVVTELSHIKELVKQLEVQLGGSPELCKHLASQIFSLTERSIGMIKSGRFDGRKHSAGDGGLDSPLSYTPSPLSDVSDMLFKNNKRKTMEKLKRQIRVSSAGGAETPIDGHSWRKYGQKEILGARHPRGYYRCTHRNTQGCVATKQVQRTDEDPTLFDVIYHGTHTCVQKAVAGQVAAPGKNQPVQNPDAHSLLQSLSSSLTVKTEGLATEPQDWSSMPFCFSSPVSGLAPEHNPFSTPSTLEYCFAQGVSLSPSLVSPATSDSNHLSTAPFHVAGDAEWRAQSELQEVVSTFVAVTSTPVLAMETDFPMDFEFDPSFTTDVSSFF